MGGGGQGRLRPGSRAHSAAKVAKISLRDTALPFAAAGGGEGRRTRQLCPGKLSTRGGCQAKYTSGRDPRGHGGDKGDLPAAGPPRLAAARDLASASSVWSPPRWPCPRAVLLPQGRNPGGGERGWRQPLRCSFCWGRGRRGQHSKGQGTAGAGDPFHRGGCVGAADPLLPASAPPKPRCAPRGPQPGRQCPPAAAGPGRGDIRGARPHAWHRDTERGAGRGEKLAKVLKCLRSVRGAPGVNAVAAFPL